MLMAVKKLHRYLLPLHRRLYDVLIHTLVYTYCFNKLIPILYKQVTPSTVED